MQLPGIARKIVGMCYNMSDAGSSYSAGPGSLMLRVPFVAQNHGNLCTDATAMMILRAWGHQPNRDTKSNPRGTFQGAKTHRHEDLVAGGVQWFNTDNPQSFATVQEVLEQLQKLGPLGAGMRSRLGGHAVVVVGGYANNGEVVVHDPWSGPMRFLKLADFRDRLTSLTWLGKAGGRKAVAAGAAWAS